MSASVLTVWQGARAWASEQPALTVTLARLLDMGVPGRPWPEMHYALTGPLYLKALIISTTVDAPSARKAIQLATMMEDSAFGMLKVWDRAGSQRAWSGLRCRLLRDCSDAAAIL